jgi:hypothetical protein
MTRVLSSDHCCDIRDQMTKVFGMKLPFWIHEKEVRALSENDYIQTGVKVTRIYFGSRTPLILKKTIAKLVEGTSIQMRSTSFDFSASGKVIDAGRWLGKE